MIKFDTSNDAVDLLYEGDLNGDSAWVWEQLTARDEAKVSRVFFFERDDVLNPPEREQDLEGHQFRFRFATVENGYARIPGRRLGIDNDVLLGNDLTLRRKLFVAERNISVFSRLAKVLNHSNPIVVGGERRDAIPKESFEELLEKFPTSYELDRYAGARVQSILAQYLHGMKDERELYERYLTRKTSLTESAILNLGELKKLEIEKYRLIRDVISNALNTKTDWAEPHWQQLMLPFVPLLFPKYIKVLENVTIQDFYSKPDRRTNRRLDMALVDANGHVDVIEIKKPFDDKILRGSKYRGNSVPAAELSGSIMQAEKYLFHLSKWGIDGERKLSKKYAADLPVGMRLRISNPKAIVIVGRDEIKGQVMSAEQRLDFEVIRRKYANMMDIITYDDLLRRLNNTIEALES